MASKKKLVTSGVALVTALALALGGTFAWQSISQTALNESSDVVNPGGRLHNDLYYTDLNTTDSNVYVENFTDPEKGGEDIFARVRLEEYMEVVLNYNTKAEKRTTLIGSRDDTTNDAGEITDTKYTYELFKFDEHVNDDGTVSAGLVTSGEGDEATTESRFTWAVGGKETEAYYYMPTFNKNKDSLAADLNGLYKDRVGGISNREKDQYEAYTPWAENGTTEGYEIYDTDSNMIDELEGLDAVALNAIIDGTNALGAGYEGSVKLTKQKVTHTAETVGTTEGLISMDEWLARYNAGEDTDNYWVYDTDGWVYWSSPIKAGEATGLLLDSFTLSQIMDNSWYYAINVVGQFITADDLGDEDGTGFYDTNVGEAPSEKALALLNAIGVEMEHKIHIAPLRSENMMALSVSADDSFIIMDSEGNTPEAENIEVANGSTQKELTAGTDYTYENGVLTFNEGAVPAGSMVQIKYGGGAYLYLLVDTDDTLIVAERNDEEGMDAIVSAVGKQIPVKYASTGQVPEKLQMGDVILLESAESRSLTASDYQYEDGSLVIINPELANSLMTVIFTEEGMDQNIGFIYLSGADTTFVPTEDLTCYSVSGTTMSPAAVLENDGYSAWDAETTYVVSNIPHDDGEEISWKLYEHDTETAADTSKIGFVTDDGLSAVALDDTAARTKNTTTSAKHPTLTLRATENVTETDWYSLVGTVGGTEKYRFGLYFGEKSPTEVVALSSDWSWNVKKPQYTDETMTIDEDGASKFITSSGYNYGNTLLTLVVKKSTNAYGDLFDLTGEVSMTIDEMSSNDAWKVTRDDDGWKVAANDDSAATLLTVDSTGVTTLTDSAMVKSVDGDNTIRDDAAIEMKVTLTCDGVSTTRDLVLNVQSFLSSIPERNDVIFVNSEGYGSPVQEISVSSGFYFVVGDDYKTTKLTELTSENFKANLYTSKEDMSSYNNPKELTLNKLSDWFYQVKNGDTVVCMITFDKNYGNNTIFVKESGFGFEIAVMDKNLNIYGMSPRFWVN